MKKFVLFLLFMMFFLTPFVVNAESKYLYDVLKDEAENGELAREYTGEHHDSFTENPSKKIYHYLGNSIDKINVIFGNFCWQMIRTTDTGGVKMIYNGIPKNGKCSNTGEEQQIGTSLFNENVSSLSSFGYMYNEAYTYKRKTVDDRTDYLFGNRVEYNDGKYTLIDTKLANMMNGGNIANNHYTCYSQDNSCEKVYYVYYLYVVGNYCFHHYIELTDGKTIEDALNEMLYDDDVNRYDSIVKTEIDTWYENNLMNYSDFLEDTIYCNNRVQSNSDTNGFNPNGGKTSESIGFYLPDDDLSCQNDTDKFSVNNSKAKLKYPIGLMTLSELNIINNYGNNYITKTGNLYWLGTPGSMSHSRYNYNGTLMRCVDSTGSMPNCQTNFSLGIRPAISLKAGIKYSSGNGSRDNPYIVGLQNINEVSIEPNDKIKDIHINVDDMENVEEGKSIIITIVPINGYSLNNLQVLDDNNNNIIVNKIDNEYTFEMPNSNVNIISYFEKVKNSVNVEIVDETKNLIVEIEDLTKVEYEEDVKFNVTSIKGYKVKSIKIIDEDNNEIEYIKTDNPNEYTFVMPASNVTIIPSYEKVANAVNVEDNINTKEIVIEVSDSKAVVYEDTVKFTITPEEGYDIDTIEIIDSYGDKVSVRKTDNKNEYEFTMPNTDVTIKPIYKKIESINVPDTFKGINIFAILFIPLLFIIVSLFIYKKRLDRNV